MSSSPTDAQNLLSRAGLKAKKSWGQNFLKDDTVLESIAKQTNVGPGDKILELGAGLGALTYHLLQRGGLVTAVERDREVVPLLRENFEGVAGLTILEANAADLDYAALAAEAGGPLTVAGNLPYQLSSRILVNLADAQPHVKRAVILVQREVAERLVAPPGDRTFGLLSVLVQRSFDAFMVRDVPPGAFHPPPKVHSTVVTMTLKKSYCLQKRTRRSSKSPVPASSARRKTLKNSLGAGLGISGPETDALLAKAGIDGVRRAETLSLAEFGAIAQHI